MDDIVGRWNSLSISEKEKGVLDDSLLTNGAEDLRSCLIGRASKFIEPALLLLHGITDGMGHFLGNKLGSYPIFVSSAGFLAILQKNALKQLHLSNLLWENLVLASGSKLQICALILPESKPQGYKSCYRQCYRSYPTASLSTTICLSPDISSGSGAWHNHER
ncbi:hypothetical protein TorRG33x02_268670 [Trema orientale]|uniref:Uncharacterized protein n=1 Tax=Trema orientale TaxID=63057 RepID=A0A2P5CYQ2_TREOI|nr:hypothetical protein TorRG33x02_268670 [Trema orientale]